ncbi:hypothetical protein WJX79_003892 [Trebouxia sp. C0005]
MLLSKAPRSLHPPLLYAGIFLDPLSTARLLSFAPPKHSKLSADHLTMIYRPSQELLRSLTLGLAVDFQVLGKIEDSTLQAVAVRCPGWVMKLLQRPAHVTVSTAEGVKPKTAGDLLQKVQQGHIYGVEYTRCTEDIMLTGQSSVVPPCSSSPVDDLVLELQLQHLMDKVPGLAPAMAGFAIEACQGNIEQATSLLQQHMPLLTQIAPESSPSPDAVRLPSAVIQPPLTVDLERNGQVGHGAVLPAAQVAFEKGNREAAQELTGKGKEHAHLAKEARQRANQAAYDSCNVSVTNRFKVDLHGLHVEEALQVLEQHLLSLGGLGCPGGILLQVITGIGKHSTNGRPKILPAVIRYLSDAGHRFSEAVGNSGIIDVSIGGQRRLL